MVGVLFQPHQGPYQVEEDTCKLTEGGIAVTECITSLG